MSAAAMYAVVSGCVSSTPGSGVGCSAFFADFFNFSRDLRLDFMGHHECEAFSQTMEAPQEPVVRISEPGLNWRNLAPSSRLQPALHGRRRFLTLPPGIRLHHRII